MNSIYTRIVTIILLPCFLPVFSPAQTRVTGKVVDVESRHPLQYVTIVQQERLPVTCTTDQFGNFEINTTDTKGHLYVTCLGYKPLTKAFEPGAHLQVEMEPDILNMKDVIVLQRNTVTQFNTLAKIDLQLNPVRNTQELLRLVPGLFIAQHAGGGKAEQIFLRGFDVDHGTDVEVSVDGLPVNMVSHAHGQGYADAHFIIPETINNIDFGAGPYYAGHGNLNTAGYVAFSTLHNIPKSRVQVETGRYRTYRTLVLLDLLKKNKDKQSAYLAADYYRTNGPTINHQNFHRLNLFGKYNLALSGRTHLTLSASQFTSRWDASGQIPVRAVAAGIIDRFGSIDPTEGGNTGRQNINLVVAHKSSNGIVWENQAYYVRNQFSLFSNFSFYAGDPANGDGIRQAEYRNIIGYKSSASKKFNLHHWAFNTTVGAGIRYDATKDSRLDRVVKRAFLANVKLGNIQEANGYGYIRQQVTRGNWLADAGLRLDYLHFRYHDKLSPLQLSPRGSSVLSPKLNIQYTVSSSLQLYIKAGKGFHSNDTRVVIANKGNGILPAAYGGDLGVIFKPGTKFLLNVAAWRLHLEQEFIYVGDEGNIEPGGRTGRKGLDLVARYQFAKNVFANLNLNLAAARALDNNKGQNYIPLAPALTSTGGVFYKTTQGFNGSITYRYIRDRPADETNSIIAKGYFMTDASINFSTQKFELGFTVENLFNVEWNEAQFATTSRLQHEPVAVTELNFTPGTPIFARFKIACFF